MSREKIPRRSISGFVWFQIQYWILKNFFASYTPNRIFSATSQEGTAFNLEFYSRCGPLCIQVWLPKELSVLILGTAQFCRWRHLLNFPDTRWLMPLPNGRKLQRWQQHWKKWHTILRCKEIIPRPARIGIENK